MRWAGIESILGRYRKQTDRGIVKRTRKLYILNGRGDTRMCAVGLMVQNEYASFKVISEDTCCLLIKIESGKYSFHEEIENEDYRKRGNIQAYYWKAQKI